MGRYISGEQGRNCAADIGAGAREALRRFTSIQIYEKSKYLRKRFVHVSFSLASFFVIYIIIVIVCFFFKEMSPLTMCFLTICRV